MPRVYAKVFDLAGKAAGKIRLPKVFKTDFRPDVIKRAVIAIQSHRIQPQGRDPMAGKKTTAESWGTGHGLSRMPRLRGVRRCAFAPGTVGGRLAHPPVVKKKIEKKIPKKEKRLALNSAIAATGSKDIIKTRGHLIDEALGFPLVVTDEMQKIKKTKDLKGVFIKLGVWPDVCRSKEGVKIRGGKGKMRGRRKKRTVGPLIVISKNEGIIKASHNLPGVDTTYVNDLNVELLAPGTHPGRFTVWTKSSIQDMKNKESE
jgi:large subunit ribosomal protein L4e